MSASRAAFRTIHSSRARELAIRPFYRKSAVEARDASEWAAGPCLLTAAPLIAACKLSILQNSKLAD